jgi:DNA-3-methyladenine glycosylase II
MSWAKAWYVRDLAQKTKTKTVRFTGFPAMPEEEVILELTKVKGISRWTAEMFLIFTLGREDIFSHGDLGLRKGMERVYGKHRTRTRKSMEAIAGRWSPYRSYGSLALWHVLDSK